MLRNSIRRGVYALFFCLLMLCGSAAFAQTGTTSLRGTVTDKSGAAILGAKVVLSSPDLGVQRDTVSGATGEYQFVALFPGTYGLTIASTGFRKFEQRAVQLLVNTPATINVTLEIGETTQTVEVSAITETLNTTDASIGNAFSENQVKQLPLEGRNVPDLLSLQAGVAYTGNRADVPAFDTRSGAVNGARSDQSNVTVDGIGVNDEGGHAFTSVLPVTLDSVQEFRVTTTNANADEGGSGGAQVALVTKSGTNQFHGSAYEYNRNTLTSANDYFIKGSQLQNGEPNQAPKLIRNIFGGSVGGPIKKDRLYFFLNYEGTRRLEATSENHVVPSDALRDGVTQYVCDTSATGGAPDTTNCPGGSVTGLSGKTYTVAPGNFALSPQALTQIDPLHVGPNAASLAYMQSLPRANTTNNGDGLNYQGFIFSAPISDTKNEYIAKMDYNLTADAKHRLSVSGALRNENNQGAPFFPGEAPSQSNVNYNKGIIVNYSGVFGPALVNNFRYGFIRESTGTIGNSNQQWVFFRGLSDQTGAVTRTRSFQRPTNVFADDLSWSHGRHSWQFGGQIALARNPRISYLSSFSSGSTNAGWVDTTGYAGKPSPLNPANNLQPGTAIPYPGVDGSFSNSYDFPLTALLGLVTQVNAQYNFQRDGSALPQGAALKRRFALNSYEMYAQDTWKVKPTFTLTLGLRYSIFLPPWETNKLEVSPTFNLGNWFANRAREGANGIPSNQDQPVAFNWSGRANGQGGFYNTDWRNLGPRFAFAWAPNESNGLLGDLFGVGKTSIRGGFGIVYDRFGQGLVDDFDQNGAFGLASTLTNKAAEQTVLSAPRLTDIHQVPTTDNNGNLIFAAPPSANFPVPFPPGTFTATTGLDSSMKTPYSYTFDLSVTRELKSGFSIQASYVGRLSRRLLTQADLAQPLNFKDKASGVDYFTAVRALAKLYRNGTNTATFTDSQLSPAVVKYWQDVIQPASIYPGGAYAIGANGPLSGCGGPGSTTDPVVMAFDLFCSGRLNETTPLQVLDSNGINNANDPNCVAGNSNCQVYFPIGGAFTFYTPQYASLYSWRTNGTANYNALQVTLSHKMRNGFQFDLNYTFSKSIDLSSDSERVGTFGGTGSQVINAWSPNQFRGVSDFDATHQVNANWIVDLPFGRGRAVGHDVNKFADAFIGGWQLSGLFRMTSGFPVSFFNGFNFPTNWDLTGNAISSGVPVGATGAYKNPADFSVNIFKVGGTAAASYFTEPFPGDAGLRNTIRGNGYFGIDLGLSKRWFMPWSEKQSLQLRWEVFNVTNSSRFDVQSVNDSIDTYGASFGNYTRLSTNPRVMQFALRYEF
jgi:hypothetical protein